jgi:hypothetical protein
MRRYVQPSTHGRHPAYVSTWQTDTPLASFLQPRMFSGSCHCALRDPCSMFVLVLCFLGTYCDYYPRAPERFLSTHQWLLSIFVVCVCGCVGVGVGECAASEVRAVLEDPAADSLESTTPSFWLMVAALKKFVVSYRVTAAASPVQGLAHSHVACGDSRLD